MTKVLPWRKGMIIGAVAVLLFLAMAAPTASAGWNSYKTITIDGSKVQGGPHTDFPVLISITDTDLRDDAQDDGDDILFTDGSNLMKLDHEIEEFDTSTGKLVAWVRVPSLTSGSDYTMRMWYNNSECESQENPETVWGSNYKMVQHLEETSATTGTYNDHLDSTANNNDGEAGTAITMDTIGKIDGADVFPGLGGGNSYVEVNDSASLDITSDFTLEAWVNITVFPKNSGDIDDVLCKGEESGTNGSYGLGILNNGSGKYEIAIEVEHGTRHSTNDAGLTTGTWYYIVAVFNDTANKAYIYLNGAEELNVTDNTSPKPNSMELEIGTCSANKQGKQVEGIIDEARISATARSADWIVTCYTNQNEPGEGGFLKSIGEEQSPNGEQPVPELSTIFLFSVGLLALAGYLYVRIHS